MIDHIDIVTTHRCNQSCNYCIDPFRNTSKKIINIEKVAEFLASIREKTDKKLTVLLLGGEPTLLSKQKLKQLTNTIHEYGFRASISTNGQLWKKAIKIAPFFDTIQVTIDDFDQIPLLYDIKDKVNVKMPGDEYLHWQRLTEFMEETKDFYRQSVPMYFNPQTFKELCEDRYVWDFLDSLSWKRDGSYKYAFYNDIRFKKCIPGETNIIDEPKIPKLYPNGNYNCNWQDETMNNYLNLSYHNT